MNRISEERDFYRRGYYIKCSRLAQERKDRKAKQLDRLLDAACLMMIGLGGAAFVYAFIDFAKWFIGG